MLSLIPHKDFSPTFEVASCFVESGHDILLLLRQDKKSEGNTWGIPAGKVKIGNETPLEGCIRETFEETGISLTPDVITHKLTTYVRYPDYDFVFYIYQTQLKNKVQIMINHDEHKEFIWLPPKQVLTLPCIRDLDECIRLCYQEKIDIITK